MKKALLLLISLLSFSITAIAQMITTDPAVPTPGRVIKIFYDSSKDAGDLHNYIGDIYAHTGVTLNGVAWQKVIGTWASNTTQPKLKYNGNYIYELDITPDLKTFYSLSATDVVTKICLVLRNAGANLQTRPDIFIDVFQAGLNVTFVLPSKFSSVIELNKKIPVRASATLADSISLYINNAYIKHGITTDLLTDTILADHYGEIWVKAVAWHRPAFAADSFFVYIRRPVTTEALPPGITDGINYTSNSSVTLVLHAPYKNYIFALGDFTGWVAREKGYMKETPDGERYWISITGLIPGKEYRFQYLVDSSLYIAEPYADKVLDPDNDQFILPATYPKLIKYPKDTASGIVSVLQTAQTPYNWNVTNFLPPAQSKLRIYELLVRDFVAQHDFKTIIDTLSYLADLGINAIELMPVTEFEGNLSWGYNPSFYFAPDKYYGPKNDLKALVDSCHKRGIAVIMDMVLNHCYGQSPFVQLYFDHYGTDQIFMKVPNPWFNASSPNTLYRFGADFNHESPSTQALVDRINAYWMTEYKIDGFRFDFTKGFTNTPGDGGAYDASRIAILERMFNRIRAVKTNAYVILEHFTADTEEKELANYGMMIWGNNNFNYSEAAMGYTSDLTNASYLGRGWQIPNLVSYMESHDEERLMYKTITFGAVSDTYNTRSPIRALMRMELATVFFLTIPGPKMIWQFGELGYDVSIDDGGRTGEKPIRWDYFTDVSRHRLYLIYKLLNGLRQTEPVFSTADYTYSLSTPLKRISLNSTDTKVNILGNFGITGASIIPVFQKTGKWYEFFSGDSVNITDVNSPIILGPGEYRIYSTRKFKSSDPILAVDDNIKPETRHFVSVYPNPSSNGFTFELSETQPSDVWLSVFSLSGMLIRQYRTTVSPTTIIKWDGKTSGGADAGKGMFFVQIRSGTRVETVKVIKQ